MEYIGLDVHRHYCVYTRLDEGGRRAWQASPCD